MLKFKRPCLSISNNLIFTASPTDSTSSTLLTRSQANCDICTKPSRPGANSTKAPKSNIFVTLPSKTDPTSGSWVTALI